MIRRALLVSLPLLSLVALVAMIPGRAWLQDRGEVSVDPDAEALALGWDDLVPEGFTPPEDPFETITAEELDKLFDGSPESERELAEIEERMSYAPVAERLDGQLVTLAGYVVPLDFDGQTRLEEFLLVPYFGACIHTPPPPANQIVMASLEEAVEIADTYEPVVLRGIMRTESTSSQLADTGYRMDVLAVEAYEEP